MDLIYQNPFRILGLPITATDREIAKRIGDMSIYADMGKPIEYNSDHFFPVEPVRTIESIEEAKQKIDQPHNKLLHALFWFWENSNNIIDEMAFEELKNGNIEKAIQFWKRETEKGITSQNKSNYKNLSTLYLGLSSQNLGLTAPNGKLNKENFLNSLSLSGEFLENIPLEEFTNQVLGIKHSVDLTEITNHFVDEFISMVKPHIGNIKSENKVTHKELLHHFGTYPDAIQNDILDKFIGKQIHNIKRQVEKSEQFRNADVSIANKAGFGLYENTQDDIKQLAAILTNYDLKYQLIADELADELVSCSIAYFNEFRDTDVDPGDDALKLAKYAKKIAVGDKLIDRIDEGIPILQEYVNDKSKREKLKPVKSEYGFIYNKLHDLQSETLITDFPSIAERFVESCKPKLDSIKSHLGRTDEDFVELSDIVAGNAMRLCFEYMNSFVKIADQKFPYNDYSKRTFLLHIVTQVEPVFDLVGNLEMSNSKRKDYTDFCNNIGITATIPYRRNSGSPSYSSSGDSSSSYSSSGTDSDYSWIWGILAILFFLCLYLIGNC